MIRAGWQSYRDLDTVFFGNRHYDVRSRRYQHIQSFWYTNLPPFFDIFPTKPEVTSPIEILSDSYSAYPNKSKMTLNLPISNNFDFCYGFRRTLRKIVYAVLNKTGSYWPILLIFNSKHGTPLGYIVSKFEQNRTKIATVRVPPEKNAKWPPWRHQIEISKIWEKRHWPMSLRLFVWSFIKIGPAV